MADMERQAIVAALKSRRQELEARGVRHLALFGSRVRGDAQQESDLDVLIEIDPDHEPVSLVGLAGVGHLIEEITGIEAVAIERHMLARHPQFAKRIADDVVEVF
jgi:predicted nucleotidyltransferase